MLIHRNEAETIVAGLARMEHVDDTGLSLAVRISAEFGDDLFSACPALLQRANESWERWYRP